jgi:tRNA-dihydrouridine synthase
LAWYLKGTPGSAAFRQRCATLNTLAEAEALVMQWLDHALDQELAWN